MLSLLSKEELISELCAQKSAYGALKKKYDDEKKAHEKLKELYVTENQSAQRRNNMDQVLLDVLEGERALVSKLLHTMVPPKIAHDLSNGIVVPPEMHRFCVIFFSDIEGFTSFGDSRPPLEVFDMLDGLFSVMDFCTSAFQHSTRSRRLGMPTWLSRESPICRKSTTRCWVRVHKISRSRDACSSFPSSLTKPCSG